MGSRTRTDIISGVVLAAAGLATLLLVIPAEISGHSDYGLPPDFFPRLLMWLLTGLAVLLVAHRMLAVRAGRTPAREGGPPLDRRSIGFIIGAAGLLALVYIVMDQVGFLAAGVLAIGFVAAIMGDWRRHPLRLTAVALAAPPVIYYAFRHLFYVFLPG